MKKNRTTPKGSPRNRTTTDYTNMKPRMLTRPQRLVLNALLDGPHTRREIDLLTGGYSGPVVIHQLRKLGVAIECHMVLYIDNFGRPGRRGVYRLGGKGNRRIGGRR